MDPKLPEIEVNTSVFEHPTGGFTAQVSVIVRRGSKLREYSTDLPGEFATHNEALMAANAFADDKRVERGLPLDESPGIGLRSDLGDKVERL